MWDRGSGDLDARVNQSLSDEGVSTFVVACIRAAHHAYPDPIDTSNIPANRPDRETGLKMLEMLCQSESEGIVIYQNGCPDVETG